MTLWMFLLNVGFYIDYRVIDKNTMFLPGYLIWALWLGVGYQGLVNWMREEGDVLTRKWGVMLARGVMAGAVLVAVAWNWRLVDLSDDWSARSRAETILRLAEPHALIIGWWDTAPAIQYLQLVEGQRPDVQAINRFLIAPNDMERLIQHEMDHRPVYVDSVSNNLFKIANAKSMGPIYQLRPRRPLWTEKKEVPPY
jgi:hypothetical protein